MTFIIIKLHCIFGEFWYFGIKVYATSSLVYALMYFLRCEFWSQINTYYYCAGKHRYKTFTLNKVHNTFLMFELGFAPGKFRHRFFPEISVNLLSYSVPVPMMTYQGNSGFFGTFLSEQNS